ncbi:solute carrier family 23 member 1-like [Apostichopus japonicus]|uniref:solute carrier family 23 member 1-like n=1 Tax=Stichopus japonicus TaxID=307972 RepID=UPI003AB5599F
MSKDQSDDTNGNVRPPFPTDVEEMEEFTPEVNERKRDPPLVFRLEERPPWPTVFILSFQIFLAVFSGILSVPLILSSYICVASDKVALSKIVGTNFFLSGLITFLQATFGSRLPVMQGSTMSYLIPATVIMGFHGDCPPALTANSTTEDYEIITNEWQSRIGELQGAIALASMTQLFIGFSGVCGMLTRFIGPITVAATISLIGISLFPVAGSMCATHWPIAGLTVFQIILYSQILERFAIPLPGGRRFSLFRFFPVLLAMLTSWGLCGILTATNVLPGDESGYGYQARTDIYPDTIPNAPWFRVPYPGQWGPLTVTAAGFLGMMAGAMTSIVESIGDYYACARICRVPPPPVHAVNRGIGIEGLGCILAGLIGSGNGSTTYGESIAIIGLTRISSRIVVQGAGAILLVVGVFGKINAVFTTLPQPIVGGVILSTFSVVASVGLSNLQFVNMNSSRNLVVFGFSLFAGLTIPKYVNSAPDIINTGSVILNQLLTITMGTSMFIGGLTACFLDNVIRGTREERGMDKWKMMPDEDKKADGTTGLSCYDLPFGMSYIRKWTWTRYLPFSPTFQGFKLCRRGRERL